MTNFQYNVALSKAYKDMTLQETLTTRDLMNFQYNAMTAVARDLFGKEPRELTPTEAGATFDAYKELSDEAVARIMKKVNL